MRRRIALMMTGLLLALMMASCKKEKTPTSSNPNQIPSDVARITGSVQDAAGNPVGDVFLHIVYPQAVPAMKTAEPMIPTNAFFYDTAEVLCTECGGTEPLSDGVMIKIFWDRNGNGPDDNDQPPPLCNDPPECRTGPAFTVNMIEFPINGRDRHMGAGLFEAPHYFRTLGDVFTPNRFYLRIFCADGRPLYTSNVMDLPGGPSMNLVHFHCTPCTGAPVVPQWRLNPSYPNPAADSLTLDFGLLNDADALVTLHGSARGRIDTLIHQSLPEGPRVQKVALRNSTNGTVANGFYTVRFAADTFAQQHTILKNDTSTAHLQNTEAAATTGGDGTFTLDAPAGISLVQRNAHGDSLGIMTLSRVRVLAIKVGYAVTDTIFDAGGGQSYNVNFVLRAP